jgi:hypothetical protein
MGPTTIVIPHYHLHSAKGCGELAGRMPAIIATMNADTRTTARMRNGWARDIVRTSSPLNAPFQNDTFCGASTSNHSNMKRQWSNYVDFECIDMGITRVLK